MFREEKIKIKPEILCNNSFIESDLLSQFLVAQLHSKFRSNGLMQK